MYKKTYSKLMICFLFHSKKYSPLLLQYVLCPTLLPVHPQNLSYTMKVDEMSHWVKQWAVLVCRSIYVTGIFSYMFQRILLNFPYFLNIVHITFSFSLTAEHMVAAAIGAILFICISRKQFSPSPFVDLGRGEGVQNVLETQHVKPW